MTSEDKDQLRDEAPPQDRSRRDFVALSAAVGIAATAGTASAASMKVVERHVNVTTPDGTCDAVFLHPATGKHPGVLVWTDIFGLRPTFVALGRRLAGNGYSVLVPNPFYRTSKSPIFTESAISSFNFRDPAARAKMQQIVGPVSAPGAFDRDAMAHVAFLDAQQQVDTSKKIGTQGYCFGGPPVFHTCAIAPDRVGAGATFHGGGLVTKAPDSPHLLIPKIKARMYIAIATSDDKTQPDAKDILRKAFADANVQAEVVVYQGMQHGWTVPDMPHQPDGKPIYNKMEAERAWSKLQQLYSATLA
ncbi:MAG: dienelactone hydrolase family protein [Steroidobacteraceae bacterium]